MKRPMTLVSGILGLVSSVFMLIPGFICFVYGIEFLSNAGYYGGEELFIFGLFGIAIGVLALVFNILTITAWNKAPEVYRAKRGKMITAIVFNFISLGAGILVSVYSLVFYFMPYLIVPLLVAAIALAIVDLCLENKRAGNVQQAPVEAAAKVEAPKATAIEEKIEKLNEMKSQGLISEEEYDELKKSYIKEQISNFN